MTLINLDILKPDKPVTAGHIVSASDEPSRFFRGGGCKSIADLLPLPLIPDTRYEYVSRGDWSHWEMVEHLLSYYHEATMFMSTWSISELSARKMTEWLNSGVLKQVYALVDFRAKNRHPAAFFLAKNNATKMRVGSCHAKVTVLELNGEFITIMGSANWTENPRIEAGNIFTSLATGQRNKLWISECIENGEYDVYE